MQCTVELNFMYLWSVAVVLWSDGKTEMSRRSKALVTVHW